MNKIKTILCRLHFYVLAYLFLSVVEIEMWDSGNEIYI